MSLYSKLRRFLFLILSLIFALSISSYSFAVFNTDLKPSEIKYVRGEILIKFKPETVELKYEEGIKAAAVKVIAPSIKKLKRKHGVYKVERIIKIRPPKRDHIGILTILERKREELSRIYKLSFPKDIDVNEVVNDFRKDLNVEYAEPNYIRVVAATPNDPKFVDGTQWALPKIKLGDTGNLDSGWNLSKGTSEIVICILDTGVDYNHVDLKGNIWVNPGEDYNGNSIFEFTPTSEGGDLNAEDDDENGYIDDIIGWDFVSVEASIVHPSEDPGPRDNNPSDAHGHGTHCSGIASAVTNNGIGIAGVGWHCSIMPVRAGYLAPNGYGYLEDADWIAGIYYAVDNGAHVISMSFGGYTSSEAAADAIDYACNAGVLLVAAAGNGDTSLKHYPSAYDNVIAVAATDSNDIKASFSNYGTWIDLSAPGVSVYSSLPGNNYAPWNGTSMSTPHIAGLAALLKTISPTLGPDQIRDKMKNSADNIDSLNLGYEGKLGSGRINAFKALSLVDYTYPEIDVLVDGSHIINGSVISSRPEIIATLTDDLTIDASSVQLLINETTIEGAAIISIDEPRSYRLSYKVLFPLEGENIKKHSILISVKDEYGNQSMWEARDLRVIPGKVKILGQPLSYPSVFKPLSGERAMITYTLSTDANISIYLYDISGNIVLTRKFRAGSPGGQGGYNSLEWNGIGDFGGTVGNGIYVYKITSGNRVIGTGKLIVYD